MTTQTDTTVRRSIGVHAGVERAFEVFTTGIDTWWPREHHVGSAPMRETVLEPGPGGRCYTKHTDGSESTWGRITAWDPPHRFVFAWMITPDWKSEPDILRSSEVEIRFTPQADGTTRVDLEHRHFERMGEGWNNVRMSVESEGGWGTLLQLYAARVEKGES